MPEPDTTLIGLEISCHRNMKLKSHFEAVYTAGYNVEDNAEENNDKQEEKEAEKKEKT